jgi:hypothetical protein
MGLAFPPYYGVEAIVKKIDKISAIDEKINTLLIEREQYVTELKEAIEKEDSKKA